MGLLTIIRKAKLKEQEVRILVLGLDNAGKSSVLHSLLDDDDVKEEISPTLGFDIRTYHHPPTGLCCNMWDIGGQETIRHFWRNYFEDTDGLVWVVDSADTSRLALCREQLAQVLQEERLVGIPVLILANKQDLAGALSEHDIAAHLGLASMGSRPWAIRACSALEEESMRQKLAMDWLVHQVKARALCDGDDESIVTMTA